MKTSKPTPVKKPKPEVTFVPGQKYVSNRGYGPEIHTYIGSKPSGPSYARVWSSPREELWAENFVRDWQEYKEPVTHVHYVHWYRNRIGEIFATRSIEKKVTVFGYPVLQCDEVKFIEK